MAVTVSARAAVRPRRFDRSRAAGLLLVLPSLLYLTVFVFIPVIKAFATSFTVRDRDAMTQIRVPMEELVGWLSEHTR